MRIKIIFLLFFLFPAVPVVFIGGKRVRSADDPDKDTIKAHMRILQSTQAPVASPAIPQLPTLSPTSILSGYNISSSSSSSDNLITVNRTYGLFTDESRTELLDANCLNQVTKLLYKNDTETIVDGKLVVISSLAVKPDEIENSGDQGIVFFSNGTLASSPSAVSGIIKFCLKSSSIEVLDTLHVDILTLREIYTIIYNGEDATFELDIQTLASGGGGDGEGGGGVGIPIPENPTVFENVFEVEVTARGCSDSPSNENLGVGDVFQLCLEKSYSGAIISSVNLIAFFNYDSVTNQYNSQIPLIENGVPLSSVVQIVTEDYVTRISVPILDIFVTKPGDKLRLGGNADVSFGQVTSEATKREEVTVAKSFQLEIKLVYEEDERAAELGCGSMLLALMKQILKLE